MGVRKNTFSSVAIPFVMKSRGVSSIHSILLAVHVQSSIDYCHVSLIPHPPSILRSSFTLLAFLPGTTIYLALICLLVLVNFLLVLWFFAFLNIQI